MRLRDVEFRFDKINKKYELVKWNSDTCYTLAFFIEAEEGYDMRTVGNMFFEDKDTWVVGKHAIEFLNAMFYEVQKENDI